MQQTTERRIIRQGKSEWSCTVTEKKPGDHYWNPRKQKWETVQ